MKLESHVEAYASSSFRRFEPFTAQKHSPRLLRQGLLRHFIFLKQESGETEEKTAEKMLVNKLPTSSPQFFLPSPQIPALREFVPVS